MGLDCLMFLCFGFHLFVIFRTHHGFFCLILLSILPYKTPISPSYILRFRQPNQNQNLNLHTPNQHLNLKIFQTNKPYIITLYKQIPKEIPPSSTHFTFILIFFSVHQKTHTTHQTKNNIISHISSTTKTPAP